MCNIVKIFNVILLLSIAINSSYAANDKFRYDQYRKKYYQQQKEKSKPVAPQKVEHKTIKKPTRFDIGLNISTKYIQYNDEQFKTTNGTYKIAGNKVNPVFLVGGGPEIGMRLYKSLNIFARGNIYLKSENKKRDTGLRWDQTLEKFGTESELTVMEASTGFKIDISLPELKLVGLKHLQQKFYFGGAIGVSRYEFDWNYLSNDRVVDTKWLNVNTVSYDTILGYKIRNTKYDNYKIELIITGFEDLPGVRYNANLMLGYFYSF